MDWVYSLKYFEVQNLDTEKPVSTKESLDRIISERKSYIKILTEERGIFKSVEYLGDTRASLFLFLQTDLYDTKKVYQRLHI